MHQELEREVRLSLEVPNIQSSQSHSKWSQQSVIEARTDNGLEDKVGCYSMGDGVATRPPEQGRPEPDLSVHICSYLTSW